MGEKCYIKQFNWLQKLKVWVDPEFFKSIIGRSAKIVSINITGAFLLFISNYLLVRFFGEEVYGDYVIINIWVNFFSVVCLFGMDDYFVATLPKFSFSTENKKQVSSVLLWSFKVFLTAFVLCVLGVGFFSKKHLFKDVIAENLFLFFIILCELTLVLLLTHFLRGVNKIEIGQWIEKTVRPGVFVLLITVLFSSGALLSLKSILWAQAGTLCVVLVVLFVIVRPLYEKPRFPVSFDRSCKSNFTFLCISLLYLLSTRLDIMYLTKHVISPEVGYYNIAARFSDLIAYPLTAFNLIVPTFLSREFHANPQKVAGIIKKLTIISLIVIGLSLVVAFSLGKTVLSFFGNNFIKSFWPFMLLSGGHLFAACGAPWNAFLMISGNQRFSLMCLVINVLTVFVLCNSLIPVYGSIGAAASVLGGGFVNLIALLYFGRKCMMNVVYNKPR